MVNMKLDMSDSDQNCIFLISCFNLPSSFVMLHVTLCKSYHFFVSKLEAELERMTSVRAQKDLILLYREDQFEQPVGTVEWLNARGWISAHHHVR